ncbi:MAG: serine/threonine-protein phosphatase, partial [Proteobacteria bacterium]|nr:serine/threonine-protein phosphatase [Pseudomonadota bacterium]
LCSDGLHGVLNDEAIAAVVAGSGGDYVDDLVEAVLEAGAPDNVAVALLSHHPSAETATAPKSGEGSS